MAEVIAHARLVITNSQTTATELADYAFALGGKAPVSEVAPLGIETAFFDHAPTWAPARPYFVCVGTLEARKNIAFLLALWRRLAERLGDETPRLVLVGRRGWENEAVIDHLQRSEDGDPPRARGERSQRSRAGAAGGRRRGVARPVAGGRASTCRWSRRWRCGRR
jgi:glycosyltransferase involved in cell wall biosynthesis